MSTTEKYKYFIKNEISSNHTLIHLEDDNLFKVNVISGINNVYVEVGFSLNYGKVKRLRSGLPHLLEHLISNKINEKVKEYDGFVTSRTMLDTMVLGCKLPYIKSKYLEKIEVCPEIPSIINLLITSIKEATDIDYIKENLENEINIIKNELSLSENDPVLLYKTDYFGYLTKDSFAIDLSIGGRFERMDELNNPEMVLDAMRFLLSSSPRFRVRVPYNVNLVNCSNYYNFCIYDEFEEFFDYTPKYTEIFEDNFFSPMNDIKELKEGDLNVIEISSKEPSSLQSVLELNKEEYINGTSIADYYIDQMVKYYLLNFIILSGTSSMVWKELRESGQTYGLYNEMDIMGLSESENGKKDFYVVSQVELCNPQIYTVLFDLIKDGVHLKYIDSEFEKAKQVCSKNLISNSGSITSLSYSLLDYGVKFKDIFKRIKEITKEEFARFVEFTLDESKCTLIRPSENDIVQ